MDPYIGEIRMFAGNFAPNGWALCNGQLISISQNTALFSILGTQYGGDGRTNFALPNLMDSSAMGAGQGPGLTPRVQGETGGEPAVTLVLSELPSHNHGAQGTTTHAAATAVQGQVWAAAPNRGENLYAGAAASPVGMSPVAFGAAGGGQPHNNLPPYLGLTFIIALQGVFPPRS